MRWFWRKPKPVQEYRTYGCFWNERHQRWELCGAEAEITKLHLIQVWEPRAKQQAELFDDYDSFQQMLRNKVEMAS